MSLCDLLVVTLGTLASLLRNRDELDKAGEVLAFDKRILDIYENIVNTPDLLNSFITGPLDTINSLRALQYKYRNIMYQYLGQVHVKSTNPNHDTYRDDIAYYYRKLIEFEILYPNILPQETMTGYACGIQWKVTNGRMPTIIDLNKVTDHKLYEIAGKGRRSIKKIS